MLFQVEGTQVYLLASMHSLPQDNNHISPEILRAYRQSEMCVFEDDHNNPRFPSPPTQCPDGSLHIWVKALSKIGEIAKENNFNFLSGIESQLLEKAQNDKKQIEFLDIENSNNAYAYAPIEEQSLLLNFATDHREKVVEFLHGIYTAWRVWDVVALTEAFNSQFSLFPKIYGRLHVTRNQTWMPKILAIIAARSPALIVAGAFHFIGEHGVCQQSKRHGFNLLEIGGST